MSNLLIDDGARVFIIRLWREPDTNADTAPEWQAPIENVSTGTRYPIKEMTTLRTILALLGSEIGLDGLLAKHEPKS